MDAANAMSRLILLNKPYGVLCQFTAEPGRACLKDYIHTPGVYAAGRLDAESEGLLLLTDDGRLQHRIAHPDHKEAKRYLVQVEGEAGPEALARLAAGVDLGDFVTRPCRAWLVAEPEWLWPRDPPVRFRKTVPTSWLEIELVEGKNRQVRRMTARVGLPTLRLVRIAIGAWRLDGLAPGESRSVELPGGGQRRAGPGVKPVERPTSPHISRGGPRRDPRPNKGSSR